MYAAPMTASTVSARIEDLSAAAGEFLAATESDVFAEADSARDFRQSDTAHEARASLGQVALGQIGVLGVEHHRHRLSENRVAEELEALVVSDAAVLVRERPVGQRKLKMLRADRDEELFGEVAGAGLFGAGVVNARHRSPPSGPTTN